MLTFDTTELLKFLPNLKNIFFIVEFLRIQKNREIITLRFWCVFHEKSLSKRYAISAWTLQCTVKQFRRSHLWRMKYYICILGVTWDNISTFFVIFRYWKPLILYSKDFVHKAIFVVTVQLWIVLWLVF